MGRVCVCLPACSQDVSKQLHAPPLQNCERFGKEYVIAMLKKDILEKSFQLEEDKSSPEAVPCSTPVQVPTISSLT